MIKRLEIKNYAIIDRLEIDFSRGLTIITGETGAGKSILLGALGLIMGNRADTKSLYDIEKKCIIEGHFDIKKYNLKPYFKKNDIDYDHELIIRRELTPTGRSRAFVNDTPVNLNTLKQICSTLIDLHQQFDIQDINNISFQLKMVDSLAGNKQLLKEYQSGYQSYLSDKKHLSELKLKDENATKEKGYYSFLKKEFEDAELIDNEQEILENELATLSHSEDIKTTLNAAYAKINESDISIISQLQELILSLSKVKNFNKEIVSNFNRLDSLSVELQDIASALVSITENTEYNPERIEELRNRLDMIYRLQNKHNVTTVEELLKIQDDISQKLSSIADLTLEIEKIENRIAGKEKKLKEIATKLSKKRKSVVAGFEEKVHHLLKLLSMEHARLKVSIERGEDLTSTGFDNINFLFSANKGGRLQLMKDVASGGELSRLNLVTKSLVASAIPLPTLIFDEIDSGISGHVAIKMGDILRKLSNNHQVITITHSPQVASKADFHYFVYKKIKDDKTVTNVKLLSQPERVKAIAMMLSKNPPSSSAIDNAKELMGMI